MQERGKRVTSECNAWSTTQETRGLEALEVILTANVSVLHQIPQLPGPPIASCRYPSMTCQRLNSILLRLWLDSLEVGSMVKRLRSRQVCGA